MTGTETARWSGCWRRGPKAPLYDKTVAAEPHPNIGTFVAGSGVGAFAEELAIGSELQHCVPVSTGTDSLVLAVRPLGADADDRVIVPANTFSGTAGAARFVGAAPALVDSDPLTPTLSVEATAREICACGATRVLVPEEIW
jgi:dTDP-4-amino-4,6-dideoxygalactose transaminase